jgi:hypothetical protein
VCCAHSAVGLITLDSCVNEHVLICFAPCALKTCLIRPVKHVAVDVVACMSAMHVDLDILDSWKHVVNRLAHCKHVHALILRCVGGPCLSLRYACEAVYLIADVNDCLEILLSK